MKMKSYIHYCNGFSQLMHQIEELKRMAVKAEAQSQGEKSKGKDTSKKSQQ